MVLGNATTQSFAQLRRGGFQPRAGQASELGRIGLTCHERLNHRPAALAHQLRDNRVQFDVGIFERLLYAQNVARLLTHQLLARAKQSAQLLRRGVRHKAGTNETMGQEIDQPLGVADVGFAAGHILDMCRIRQNQVELSVG
jgi:hypothetical protein